MSTLVRGVNPAISLDLECRTRLLDRVSNSICFQRAPRLRELLEYLCHIGPTGAVSEHQIGINPFKGLAPFFGSTDYTAATVTKATLLSTFIGFGTVTQNARNDIKSWTTPRSSRLRPA